MADGKPNGKGNGKGNDNPPFPIPDKPRNKHSSEISPEVQRRANKIAEEIKKLFENLPEMTQKQRAVEKVHLLRLKNELERMGLQLELVYKIAIAEGGDLVGFGIDILIIKPKKPN